MGHTPDTVKMTDNVSHAEAMGCHEAKRHPGHVVVVVVVVVCVCVCVCVCCCCWLL